MLKKLITAVSVLSVLCALFSQTLNISAAPSSKSYNASVTQSSPIVAKTPQPVKKLAIPKVVNGELDLESNLNISGQEKQKFEKCKQEEKFNRSVRNKNKPTACIKQPQFVNEELTDQDYTTLIDKLQDKKDIDDGKNMNVELKLKDFFDIKNIEVCNEEGFNDKAKVVAKLGLAENVNISKCSNSPSYIASSPISSSVSTQSSNLNLISKNSSTTSKSSFFDFLFGSVKADAAGVESWDYRFPYPAGTRVGTLYTFNDVDTHANHNAIDFYSLSNVNNNLVAAKGGKVVVSSGDFGNIGNHIVILQDDGYYALYGHLSDRVALNSVVKRGEYIGKQGKTGAAGSTEHLHFEVLKTDILNYIGTVNGISGNCTYGLNYSQCYNTGFKLDQYKVKPIYDECFISRGGYPEDEPDCKYNGGNIGYPWKSQYSWWTSINTPPSVTPSRPPVYNNQPGTLDLRNNPDTWSLDVQNYGELNSNGSYDQTPVNMIKRTGGANSAQKWQYFPSSREIKGMNDMCLEPGFGNDGDFLRVNACHGGTNQKWSFNSNYAISNDFSNRCINFENNFQTNGWRLVMRTCNASAYQIWNANGLNVTITQPQVSSSSISSSSSSATPVPQATKTQNIFWRDTAGNNSVISYNNFAKVSEKSFDFVPTEWIVAGNADFNNDGKSDILWRNLNNGVNVIWNMDNGVKIGDGQIQQATLDWSVAGIGDFNGDGWKDILWRNTNGQNVIWNLQNRNLIDQGNMDTVPTSWKVASVSDFNNDGKTDIFWRNTDGINVIWNMNNHTKIGDGQFESLNTTYSVAGIGDFNADGKTDIFWRSNTGIDIIWNMNNRTKLTATQFDTVPTDWIVAGVSDFNLDGKSDIFWRNTNGVNVIWNMNNATKINDNQLVNKPTNFKAAGVFEK
jgi:murein DD-endopeptidase MepM/ murein hydrolase activator NlpD